VANTNSNTVSVIDTTTILPSVIDTVVVGNLPQSIAVTPDGTRVYVVNTADNTVSVIGTTTAKPSVIATVTVNLLPNGVAVGPAGNRVYTANSSGNVTVIDNTNPPIRAHHDSHGII
jgi:YVTN family beta-propeller protein